MATNQAPWAILLCKFVDDNNDPSVITLAGVAGASRTIEGRPRSSAPTLNRRRPPHLVAAASGISSR